MGHCYGNRAQYERNRTFRYLVYVAGRKANAAKLPSEGLRLNASKSESRPGMLTIFSVLVTLCGMNMSVSTDFGARSGVKPCY